MILVKGDGGRDVVIVEHLDPLVLSPGGIDSIVHDIVKYAQLERFKIVGITADRAIPIGRWKEIEFAGKTVQYLPVAYLDRFSPSGIASLFPHSLLFGLGLIRYQRQLPQSEYHAHRIETGLIVRLLRRQRLIQFIHNDSTGLLGKGSDSIWRYLSVVYRAFEGIVAKSADHVVLFNRTDSTRLRSKRSDLIVSRTWFDTDIFSAPHDREANVQGDTIPICWVGRLDQQKDPLLAIEVVQAIKELGVNPRLKIVGDGVLLKVIRAKITELDLDDEIELMGSLTRKQVSSVMAANRALLMTSRYEGSPVVLLEAGASGLPVVATEESDPDCALIPGENGERVANRDAVELARALLKSVRYSPETCRRLAASRSGRSSVPLLLSSISS